MFKVVINITRFKNITVLAERVAEILGGNEPHVTQKEIVFNISPTKVQKVLDLKNQLKEFGTLSINITR